MRKGILPSYFMILMVTFAGTFLGCKSGPFNLIKPATPHEQYERKLINAGLNQSAMGTAWLNAAQQSLQQALSIQLPYQERGYFAADKVEAASFKVKLIRGQKLKVQLTKKPASGFMIYLDVWEYHENGTSKFIIATDTLGGTVELDAENTGEYIIRLQPELLSSGEYTLVISSGPSLQPPLKSMRSSQIQSFFGAGRDNNSRKHEGIDIFAPFRTPVIAVAPGTITGVNMNNLGGKVVWFRPEGKNYTLYYAHLDEQTVTEGQTVALGDTLGRMGNTGNAKATSPHLHFGVYTNTGAIDPLPFINPNNKEIPKISAPASMINSTMRTNNKVSLGETSIAIGTIVRITAATGNDFRVVLPDGNIGYVKGSMLSTTNKPLTYYRTKTLQELYDRPMATAAVKLQINAGQTLAILGNFGEYQLAVAGENKEIGWIKRTN